MPKGKSPRSGARSKRYQAEKAVKAAGNRKVNSKNAADMVLSGSAYRGAKKNLSKTPNPRGVTKKTEYSRNKDGSVMAKDSREWRRLKGKRK